MLHTFLALDIKPVKTFPNQDIFFCQNHRPILSAHIVFQNVFHKIRHILELKN